MVLVCVVSLVWELWVGGWVALLSVLDCHNKRAAELGVKRSSDMHCLRTDF